MTASTHDPDTPATTAYGTFVEVPYDAEPRKCYQEVKTLIQAGNTRKAAVTQVAKRMGRTMGTVQIWYQHGRRTDPDPIVLQATPDEALRKHAYDEFKALMLAGSTREAATTEVAQRLGRSTHTVQAWYKRQRRTDPNPVVLRRDDK